MKSDVLESHHTRLPLWEFPPGSLGDGPDHRPELAIHLADHPNGCGVIVCPGGGYRTLASDHEGLQVAQWLNEFGVHAFVLRYRLGPQYHSSISRQDGQRAVRMVRHHASEWGLDSMRLGMLGFSAGGHLALATALTSEPKANESAKPATLDVIDALDCRPNFLVPVYAVTNGARRGRKADEYLPMDTLVTAESPPTFVVHNHQDSIVPASQATLLYDALLQAGVPAELHIFNFGEHGLGLNRGAEVSNGSASTWGDLLIAWLRRHGFFLDQSRQGKRCAVQGQVFVDGEPMGLGWLTLVPQRADSPLARVRLNATGGGRFHLDQCEGPVPGPHRLILHMVSSIYPPDTSGSYSMERALMFERSVEVVSGEPLDWNLKRTDGVAI
jgi:acetyl esterase/lipase